MCVAIMYLSLFNGAQASCRVLKFFVVARDFNSSHALEGVGINVTEDGRENIVMHVSSKSLSAARATKCQTDV